MEKSSVPTVVFVHGIFSSSDTWQTLLKLFQSDPDMAGIRLVTFEYSSPKFRLNPAKTIPDFDTAARSLRVFLDTQVSNSASLMLVAHSQGGLVVQRYLAQMVNEGSGLELQRLKRVVLLATPNAGSGFFLSLRKGMAFWNHVQERQLRPLNDEVAIAHSVVVNRVVHASGIDANQCPVRITAYAGEEDGVVPSASAFGAFIDRGVLPGDHSTIVRPSSDSDTRYVRIKRDVRDSLVPPSSQDFGTTSDLLDRTQFVSELTVPDGSIIEPGADFIKVWIIRNAGEVYWKDRALRRVGGAYAPGLIVAPELVQVPDTAPGAEVRIEIKMKAPNVAAFTTCVYKMIDSQGRYCFPDRHPAGLSAVIQVMRNLED